MTVIFPCSSGSHFTGQVVLLWRQLLVHFPPHLLFHQQMESYSGSNCLLYLEVFSPTFSCSSFIGPSFPFRFLFLFSFFLCRARDKDIVSVLDMWIFSYPNHLSKQLFTVQSMFLRFSSRITRLCPYGLLSRSSVPLVCFVLPSCCSCYYASVVKFEVKCCESPSIDQGCFSCWGTSVFP